MSRKKIKKEYVKRKTNIYDPMGVYARGPTREQKVGMSKQMKLQYLETPKPRINRQLLDEYRKTLIFYGIPTVGNVDIVRYSITGEEINHNFNNDEIINYLKSININPVSFIVDSVTIDRPIDSSAWSTSIYIKWKVGNDTFTNACASTPAELHESNGSITIPGYWINGTRLNYLRPQADNNGDDMTLNPTVATVGNRSDFNKLPKDGTNIPYLLYPNFKYPPLSFDTQISSAEGEYMFTLNITVIH